MSHEEENEGSAWIFRVMTTFIIMAFGRSKSNVYHINSAC